MLSDVGDSPQKHTVWCLMHMYLSVAEHMDVYIRIHLTKIALRFVQLLKKRITLDRYQERWALERGGLKLTAISALNFFFLHFLWTKISGTVTNPCADCPITSTQNTHRSYTNLLKSTALLV